MFIHLEFIVEYPDGAGHDAVVVGFGKELIPLGLVVEDHGVEPVVGACMRGFVEELDVGLGLEEVGILFCQFPLLLNEELTLFYLTKTKFKLLFF